jgi:GTP-binding protein HflX
LGCKSRIACSSITAKAIPAFLLGTGKAEEIAALAREEKLDAIVFDNELTPSQQRNWEKLSGVAVLDRQEVILAIFGRRAQTREARLQVELAQLEYSLPRLTRAWGHLVRQGGGIGGRGEGESQLEQDKRRIRGAIERCKRELESVRSSRATQRKDRKRTPVPNAAIVGYTNAGKSSLLKRLTGADVLIEDKLFATLDTTTRKIALPNKLPLLLTDTVGFVRKLPHRLVEASTPRSKRRSRRIFLVHLLDASQPEIMEFYNTTMKVLAELGADEKKMLIVFNKIDKVDNPAVLTGLGRHFPEALFISVQTVPVSASSSIASATSRATARRGVNCASQRPPRIGSRVSIDTRRFSKRTIRKTKSGSLPSYHRASFPISQSSSLTRERKNR